MNNLVLTLAVGLTLLPFICHAQTAVGTGFSTNPDMQIAADMAAFQAKRELKGAAPKLVLVADGYRGDKQLMLNRIAKYFPKQTIYGGMSFGAICDKGFARGNSIAVVAIADPKMKITAARADGVKADMHKAGVSIANGLGCQAGSAVSVMLMGDCHVPTDQTLVEGVQSVLGDKLPIYGGSTSFEADSYYQGVARRDSAFGIATMNSKAASVLAGGSANEKEALALALQSMKTALQTNGNNKMLMLFECAGRQGLFSDCDLERQILMAQMGKQLPIFGFYGSGEIGQPDGSSKSEGRGVHVSAAGVGW